NQDNLAALNINYPDIREQQKIGRFLNLIDKKIELQQRKIEVLKMYKKGLERKVFNTLSKSTNNKIITEIADTFIGLVTTMTEHYVENGVRLIRNSDIKENQFIFNGDIFLDENFANKNCNRKHIIGDIVTVHTGDVGTSAIIDEKLNGSIGFATIVTRVKNNEIANNKYICWYYNSSIYKNIIKNIITGDGRNNLNMKDFNKIKIPLPSIEQQEKISNIFENIKSKIVSCEKEYKVLVKYKKYLLQQMFI
ncbi:MAG: restriction endonuclease subunit S, partial [Clostridia bacterium]|nr:restriction endonuclease subunit S [Clostridia bacterium]